MGCLAAQLVSHFKGDEAGQFYLYPVSAVDCGQDYEYHIYSDQRGMCVRITDRGCNMFGLTKRGLLYFYQQCVIFLSI